MEKTETVFVTKYALSDGIMKLECEIGKDGYAVHWGERPGIRQFFSRKNWHRTWPDALVDAQCRRGLWRGRF